MVNIELSKTVKNDIQNIKRNVFELEKYLEEFQILNKESFDCAVDLIKDYKSDKAYLEKEKNSINKPINEIRNKVNSWFNPPIKLIDNCISILRSKIIDYENNFNKKRLKSLKKREKVEPKINSSEVSFREFWDYEIENFNKIPREYLCLDHSLVKIELREKGHELKIPGIIIFKNKTPIIRIRGTK